MIDFTNCEVNKFKAYGGANGNKINIRYEGKEYMLKFPPVSGEIVIEVISTELKKTSTEFLYFIP